jgi:hypothetical protein
MGGKASQEWRSEQWRAVIWLKVDVQYRSRMKRKHGRIAMIWGMCKDRQEVIDDELGPGEVQRL